MLFISSFSGSQMIASSIKTDAQVREERAEFLLNQALDNDEAGNFKEALNLYTEAVEFCLKCVNSTADNERKIKFRKLANQSLDRAEAIKKNISARVEFPSVPTEGIFGNLVSTFRWISYLILELANLHLASEDSVNNRRNSCTNLPSPSNNKTKSKTKETLDESELKVLASTTRINDISYVPFLDFDLNERFAYPVPFRYVDLYAMQP
jgi:calpain-7